MRGIRTPTYPALPECSAVKTSMVAPKFNACREADVETVPGRSPLLTVVPRAINPNPPRDSILASSRGSVGFNYLAPNYGRCQIRLVLAICDVRSPSIS